MRLEVEILDLKNVVEERDQKTKELCEFLKEKFDAFSDLAVPDTGEDRLKLLREKIPFMYA